MQMVRSFASVKCSDIMNTRDKRALADTTVTLNGKPAKVSGVANDYATVTDLANGTSHEYCWETVKHVIYTQNGAFKS
jgi:hypothetical protein